MSNQQNQRYKRWKDVESQIRRAPLSRRGTLLTDTNLLLVQDAYMLLYLVWEDALTFSGNLPVPHDLPSRWLTAMLKTDLEEVFSVFKDVDNFLMSLCETAESMSYSDFKHHFDGIPSLGTLMSPLKGMIEHVLRVDEHVIAAFRVVHQCLAFSSRLNLHGLVDLEEEALVTYVDNLERVRNHSNYGNKERTILQRWFPKGKSSEYYSEFYPSHGNGSVAEQNVKSMYDKYMAQSTDQLLQYIDRKTDLLATGCSEHSLLLDRTCRLQFVPKSVSKLRSIAMEPATLQYYQHGFLRSLNRYFKGHPYLRRRIDLERGQDRNRHLARLGSKDGSYSTIDLSMASDSVSIALIRDWFRGTFLYPSLITTRSTHVMMPDGTKTLLPLYASMGSALCFPIECIVFAAITEAGIIDAGGDPRRSNFSIYGDDIVVETRYADAVMHRLEMNGFLPNRDKTFTRGQGLYFRESCGGEFVNGVDVTPLRLSRFFSGIRKSATSKKGPNVTPAQFVGAIDLCNRTLYELPFVRAYLIKELNKLPTHLRPIFVPIGEADGIQSDEPSNFMIRHKKQYGPQTIQNVSFVHGASRTKTSKAICDAQESVRLFETLRSMTLRGSDYQDSFAVSKYEPVTVSKPPPPVLRSVSTLCHW